jgi:hypothetical protein
MTVDPIDLEMELFFGFDCSPPPESPRSTRSKSTSLSGDVSNEENICPEKSCRQSFRRANALQRHIASIHQRSGETCPFCPEGKRAFNRSDNFQRWNIAPRLKLLHYLTLMIGMCLLDTPPFREMIRGCGVVWKDYTKGMEDVHLGKSNFGHYGCGRVFYDWYWFWISCIVKICEGYECGLRLIFLQSEWMISQECYR